MFDVKTTIFLQVIVIIEKNNRYSHLLSIFIIDDNLRLRNVKIGLLKVSMHGAMKHKSELDYLTWILTKL